VSDDEGLNEGVIYLRLHTADPGPPTAVPGPGSYARVTVRNDGAVAFPAPGWPAITHTITGTSSAICPDLLSIRDLGVADNWRGRLVRGIFHVLRLVTRV